MFITIKHLTSEKMIKLEDIESFSSKRECDGSDIQISLQIRNRSDSRDFIVFSQILVHDEDGSTRYERITGLDHLTELIDREKNYYSRKESINA